MRKEDLAIIIVDDLQFSREVVKSGLRKSGYEDIRTAASADEALFMLNERRAHVVLADFWMPCRNGLEMTDLIRRWDENNDRYTGIVLLTAEDTASSILVAFDRGVDDFVSKSANQFELAARVYGAGRHAHQLNELRTRMNRMGEQLLEARRNSLRDVETQLPNRVQLEAQMEITIEHCITRGGGLGLALIEVGLDDAALRPANLQTIANAIQLALRPLDLVARFDRSMFAVLVQYDDPEAFNLGLFDRLLENIRRQSRFIGDQGTELQLAIGVWHGHQFEPAPTPDEIIGAAREAIQPV